LTKGDTGHDVIPELRSLVGPTDSKQAKEEAPDTLRALYGTNHIENAVHTCDSRESAARELAFFFPEFGAPWVPGREPPIQKTFALIRPDVARDHKDEILAQIKEAGFTIALEKQVILSEDQIADFYAQHTDKDWFGEFTKHMQSGPVLALALAREEAVEKWREMLGPRDIQQAKQEAPESLRAVFSTEDAQFNGLHGAASPTEAERELDYFFPVEQTVAVVKPDGIQSKDLIVEKIKAAGFDVALQKEQHLTKELAQQLYHEHEGKDFYEGLIDYMSSGSSLFMVLSRRDAISGWRAVMGPTDPNEAKQINPDSLRALIGCDKLKNAVHGSSNHNHAQKVIKTFFGDVNFDSDGKLITVTEGEPEEAEMTSNAHVDADETKDEPEGDGTSEGDDGTPEEPKNAEEEGN
jgi:nucleoside diphosphate kinase